MQNVLIKHAIKNIWCTPDQDRQHILELTKITPYQGAVNSFSYMFITLRLPVQKKRFHLYQVGQIYPQLLGLRDVEQTWVRCDDSINEDQVLINLYSEKGIELPRGNSWYIITEERALIFAVEESGSVNFNPNQENLFIRVYKNAYFSSDRSDPSERLEIRSKYINSNQDIIDIQTQYQSKLNQPGAVIAFCNGVLVPAVGMIYNQIGDWVEYYYDPSVKSVLRFDLSELQSFHSTLDQTNKFLIRKERGLTSTIEYQDDIDLFLFDKISNKGVYHHKNAAHAMRMVTHQDYSITAGIVNAFIDENEFLNIASVEIVLYIRKSGYERPLVYENNRIKELYKLPQPLIQQAMVGVDATVDVWKAASLESSMYTAIMGMRYRDITLANTTEALGYHAIVKTTAQGSLKTTTMSGQKVCDVPTLYQTSSTVFEYDINGYLLGYTQHNNAPLYTAVSPDCWYVDFTRGNYSTTLDEVYNQVTTTLDPQWDYRFYVAVDTGNAQTTVWQDITGQEGYYTLVGNTLTWTVAGMLTLVRSNKTPLVHSLTENFNDGVMIFTIVEEQVINSVSQLVEMKLPTGEIDIFLNGKYLINGIDYHLDFPHVYVWNKSYLNDTDPQQITYRLTGLQQTEISDKLEMGFIRNNRLSLNHQFDLRDDRPVKLFIGGGIRVQEDLVFNEDSLTYDLYNASNGKPYSIKEYVVPVKDITNQDTYSLRKMSRLIDNEVSDYLTVYIPIPDAPDVSPMPQKHQIYSVMIAKVIKDLKTGILNPSYLGGPYGDSQIRNTMIPYMQYYERDCINPDYTPSQEYVTIQPHPYSDVVSLNVYQYQFVQRVINLYARDLTTLSGYCVMS